MVKLTIRNESQRPFLIQEGNAGIFRSLKVLKFNETYVLVLDPNGTYREYYFTRIPDNTQLPALSSDDILEFSEIILKDVPGGDTTLEGIPRRGTTHPQPLPPPQPPPPPQPSKFIKILKLLWNGNTSLT